MPVHSIQGSESMNELENAIKNAQHELNGIDKTPFSDKGFAAFEHAISAYVIQLFDESIRSAKKDKVEIVSPTHVDSAANYLTKKPPSKMGNFIITLGGIFLGAAISNIASMALINGDYSFTGLLITILFAMIGSFMLGLYFFKE